MSPKKRDEIEEEGVDPLLAGKIDDEDVDGLEEKELLEDDDDGIPEGASYFYGDAADAI